MRTWVFACRALRAIDEGYLFGIAVRVVDPHSILRDYVILCVESCTELLSARDLFAMPA